MAILRNKNHTAICSTSNALDLLQNLEEMLPGYYRHILSDMFSMMKSNSTTQ